MLALQTLHTISDLGVGNHSITVFKFTRTTSLLPPKLSLLPAKLSLFLAKLLKIRSKTWPRSSEIWNICLYCTVLSCLSPLPYFSPHFLPILTSYPLFKTPSHHLAFTTFIFYPSFLHFVYWLLYFDKCSDAQIFDKTIFPLKIPKT